MVICDLVEHGHLIVMYSCVLVCGAFNLVSIVNFWAIAGQLINKLIIGYF